MPKPRWKGVSALTEAPTSPRFDYTETGDTCTRSFGGPYLTLKTNAPKRGQVMNGSPSTYKVSTVSLEKAPGGRGILTVTLSTVAAPPFDEDVPEVEWNEIQKKLELHPRYTTGAHALTSSDLDKIEDWRNAASASERDKKYAALSSRPNAQEFINKLRRGQDSYVIYSPVCRITRKTTLKPTNTKCGIIDSPPASVRVAGYDYLKTADRSSRQNNYWTRTQEWTGAESVDPDIYST